MSKHSRIITAFLAGLVGIVAVASLASLALAGGADRRSVSGTIWVANRGAHTIQGFDARTGDVVDTVDMAANSQPGDLAYARGKLYVAEEFGASPGIAVVDPRSGDVLKRFPIALPIVAPPFPGPSARPHHVHASADGKLVAFGLYGTDMVAVVETRTDTLLGPWDTNPVAGQTSGRAHAGVFSKNGKTLYVASDASSEIIALDPRTGEIFWSMNVPGAHELAVSRDGKTAYVSRRTANKVAVVDLMNRTFADVLTFGNTGLPSLPDTLQLSANEKLLTIGMRSMPARMAVVDTRTFDFEIVNIGTFGEMTTLAGHQWTSRNGRTTFAAFEGGSSPGVAVIDHRAGNDVVQTFAYPGRPHGVDLVPTLEDDDDDDEDD